MIIAIPLRSFGALLLPKLKLAIYWHISHPGMQLSMQSRSGTFKVEDLAY